MRRYSIWMVLMAVACGGPEAGSVDLRPHPIALLPDEPGFPLLVEGLLLGATMDSVRTTWPELIGPAPFVAEGQYIESDEVTIDGHVYERVRSTGRTHRALDLSVKSVVDVGQGELRDLTARRLQSGGSLEISFKKIVDVWRVRAVDLRARCVGLELPDGWGDGSHWRRSGLSIRLSKRNGDCRIRVDDSVGSVLPASVVAWQFHVIADRLATGSFERALVDVPERGRIDYTKQDVGLILKDVVERAALVEALRLAFLREVYVGDYRVFENDDRAVGVYLPADRPMLRIFSPPRSRGVFERLAKKRGLERWL